MQPSTIAELHPAISKPGKDRLSLNLGGARANRLTGILVTMVGLVLLIAAATDSTGWIHEATMLAISAIAITAAIAVAVGDADDSD